MKSEESQHAQDWMRIAEKDLQRFERCLRDEDPEAAGFFLQQAVEKFLKAFLLARGWQLRRIHDLEALLDDAVDLEPSLECHRSACQRVTKYYTLERYPLLTDEAPAAEEIQADAAELHQLIKHIRRDVT